MIKFKIIDNFLSNEEYLRYMMLDDWRNIHQVFASHEDNDIYFVHK